MNYVVFYCDEMRATGLSCYGNTAVSTPNFDRLAAEGTLFENHYVQNPVCLGSRCSLLTGWYPHVKGFRNLGWHIPAYEPNFLRYFLQAGYNVQFYGKNHALDDESLANSVTDYKGFKHSWQKESRDGKKDAARHLYADDYTMLFPPLPNSELEEIDDSQTTNRGVDFLRSAAAQEPFVLFLSLNNPHAPYVMCEEFYSKYAPEDMPPLRPADIEGQPLYRRLLREYQKLGEVDEAVLRKVSAVYHGMIAYCDAMLGRVLKALDDTGLAGDTMVLATSDHGDWAGDYGMIEKWPNAFDDDMTRVPLIVRTPGAAAGHRVRELVGAIDIFPTLLDYAGIPIGHDQFGRSLRAQLEGAAGDPEAAVYSEGGYDTREPQSFEGRKGAFDMLLKPNSIYYPKMMLQQEHPEAVSRGTMIRKGGWKLVVRTHGDNELYNLAADPMEIDNRYDDPAQAALIGRMKDEMLLWYIHTSDVAPR